VARRMFHAGCAVVVVAGLAAAFVAVRLVRKPPVEPASVSLETATVSHSVVLRGRIHPSLTVPVSASVPGTVHGPVPELAAPVAAGARLLTVSADAGFKNEVAHAFARLAQVREDVARRARIALRSPFDGRLLRWHVRARARVAEGDLLAVVAADGAPAAAPAETEIRAPAAGVVLALLAHPGNRVSADDILPLCFIAPSDGSEGAAGEADAEQADQLLRAQRELDGLELAANRSFDDPSLPGDAAYVLSPVDGVVIWRAPGLAPGAPVSRGQEVLRVASRHMVVTCGVHEIDYPSLAPGQVASVVFDAVPDRQLEARVVEKHQTPTESVFEQFSEYAAVLELADHDPALVDGMSCTVTVAIEQHADAPSLPRSALVSDRDGRSAVLVREVSGLWQLAPVATGLVGDDRVEILDGLGAQDRVALFPAKVPKPLRSHG